MITLTNISPDSSSTEQSTAEKLTRVSIGKTTYMKAKPNEWHLFDKGSMRGILTDEDINEVLKINRGNEDLKAESI